MRRGRLARHLRRRSLVECAHVRRVLRERHRQAPDVLAVLAELRRARMTGFGQAIEYDCGAMAPPEISQCRSRLSSSTRAR